MKNLAVGRLVFLIGFFSIGLVTSTSLLAQALTPAQLTSRVEETSRALEDIQKDLKRMNTLIDNRAMLDIFQRVDELADEISQLRGELELQASDLAGIKTRQRELYLDIDRRMRDLEDRAVGQSSTLVPVPATGTSSTTTSEVPASTEAADNTTQTVAAAQSSANLNEEKAAYQVAFNSLKEGRYKKAKEQFNKFLKDYPDSIYAGNAQYWLGEANYVTRNFKQAVTEFNRVSELHPTSAKIPDSMLKLGYTHYELKQYDQARTVLQELRKQYPSSTAARLAGKRLDRMRKEGV
jgi:tol-pal system protein YbgF